MSTADKPHGKIINLISQSMHLRFDESVDQSAGITQGEHQRRHYLWVSGLLAGLAFAADYPNLAMSALSKVRAHPDSHEFALPFVADFLAREIGEQVFDKGQKDLATYLNLKRDVILGARQTETVPVKAVFSNDGVLTWEDKKPGEYPLETWRDQWEDWEGVE